MFQDNMSRSLYDPPGGIQQAGGPGIASKTQQVIYRQHIFWSEQVQFSKNRSPGKELNSSQMFPTIPVIFLATHDLQIIWPPDINLMPAKGNNNLFCATTTSGGVIPSNNQPQVEKLKKMRSCVRPLPLLLLRMTPQGRYEPGKKNLPTMHWEYALFCHFGSALLTGGGGG